MRRSLLLAIALLAACGGDPAPPDGGPTLDAFVPDEDAGPDDAGPVEVDGGCDVGEVPDPLPAIAGGFGVEGGDAGSVVPAATGGDPVGLWVFDRATFYVGPTAAGMFDEDASTVEGTAWLEVTEAEFALDWRFVTTLMGTPAGTIVRPSSTQIRASYTLDGATFVATPICVQSGSGGDGETMLAFSQSGDTLTAVSHLSGPTGMITIVLEGTRRTR